MSKHSCIWSCNGSRFEGLSIYCKSCSHPWFLECLPSNHEVVELLNILNLKVGTINQQAKERAYTALRTIFGQNEMFEFKCPNCIINIPTKIQQLESTHEADLKTIIELKEEIDRLNGTITNVEANLTQSVKFNSEYQQQIDQLKKQLDETINAKMDFTEERAATIGELHELLEKYNAKICNQFENCSNFSDMSQELKRKKTIDQRETITAVNSGHRATNVNAGAPQNSFAPINDTNDLKPPTIVKENKSIYEIHLSEFDIGTTIDDIVRYIMQRTTIIMPDLFNVEMLPIEKKIDRESVSFKISTLKRNIYNEIMNQAIWSPNFVARDYLKQDNIWKTPMRKRVTYENRDANYSNNKTSVFYTPKTNRHTDPRNFKRKFQEKNEREAYDNKGAFRRNKPNFRMNHGASMNWRKNRGNDTPFRRNYRNPSNLPQYQWQNPIPNYYMMPQTATYQPIFQQAYQPNQQPVFVQPNPHQQRQPANQQQ